jgi:LacI family repressor for deo operon, udp, cdd, tsx, nupC, and nupG
MKAARQAGLACPADVSIVGFDDVKISKYMDPPLTTVSQPMSELGRQTVLLLLDILAGRNDGIVSITLPHHFIHRGSTAPPKRRTGARKTKA